MGVHLPSLPQQGRSKAGRLWWKEVFQEGIRSAYTSSEISFAFFPVVSSHSFLQNAAEDQDNDFNVWSQELWATIAKRFGVTAKAEGAALEDNKISGPLPFTVKDVELKWTKGAQTAQFAPSEGVGLGSIAESTELVDPEALDKRSMR